MNEAVAQATIFLPLLAVGALSLIALIRMFSLRAAAVRGHAVRFSYYRAFQGTPEPEAVAAAARHYNNLFEAPVLFYVGCIVAFEVSAVTPWMLVFAWGFVIARIAQSVVHLTWNNVNHRAIAFAICWLFIAALWIDVAQAVIAQT